VTRWSNPDSNGQKWPEEAQLVVGWGGIQETFTSKIYCVPGKIVEAVGGRAQTNLKRDEIGHHTHAPGESKPTSPTSSSPFPSSLNPFASDATEDPAEGILTHLMTRWTVRPFPDNPPPVRSAPQEGNSDLAQKEHTEVSLAIEFQFSNPIYSAMSAAVTDRIAGLMIEAFEGRVKQVLEGGVDGIRESGRTGC
jgi:coenzyme Q-binding protein COQ10